MAYNAVTHRKLQRSAINYGAIKYILSTSPVIHCRAIFFFPRSAINYGATKYILSANPVIYCRA